MLSLFLASFNLVAEEPLVPVREELIKDWNPYHNVIQYMPTDALCLLKACPIIVDIDMLRIYQWDTFGKESAWIRCFSLKFF